MSVTAFINKFGGWTEEYKFYNDEVTLRYDVKRHVYLLLKEDGNLEEQDGVTNIVHIIDKSAPLIAWACKMMSQRLLQEGVIELPTGEKLVRQMSYQEFENFVLDAKDAHKEKLEEAGEVGHIAHAWIENYIKAVIAKNDLRIQELLAKFPDDERASNCCIAAMEWMHNHNVRWIGTERKIYSRKYKYAGTLDGLCMVDSCTNPHCCKEDFKDRLTVSDWKTSNNLYIEYLLQTAAYMQAYNEETIDSWNHGDPEMQVATDRWIIRLGKEDAEFDPWHAGAETFNEDLTAFLEALSLLRSTRSIKQRVTDKANAVRDEKKAERQALRAAQEEAESTRKALRREAERVARKWRDEFKCPKADKFKGTKFPKCNDGKPCTTCLNTFYARHPSLDTRPTCDGEHGAPACGVWWCWQNDGPYPYILHRPDRLLGPGA